MKDENQNARRAQIEQAAYDVLAKKGFGGASMLAIARTAKASNETLYNWYGDKIGLFRAMVIRNAKEARDVLLTELDNGSAPLQALEAFGPKLLHMLSSDRVVALNRAAAADPSNALGTVIATEGRNNIAPLVGRVLMNARAAGLLQFDDTAVAADLYLSLLIGDLQIRRVIAQIPQPSADDIANRAARALEQLQILLAPEQQ